MQVQNRLDNIEFDYYKKKYDWFVFYNGRIFIVYTNNLSKFAIF